jgi:hypothetical protein
LSALYHAFGGNVYIYISINWLSRGGRVWVLGVIGVGWIGRLGCLGKVVNIRVFLEPGSKLDGTSSKQRLQAQDLYAEGYR